MRTLTIIIALIVATATNIFADYMLPQTQDRVLLLVNLSSARLDKNSLVLAHGASTNEFIANQFWMQDRIYSDGICTGIQDDHPRSAASRIKEVHDSIAKQEPGRLLIELVLPKDSPRWIVTYLREFNAATEFPRYFPKQEFYDTIKLPDGFKADSPADFQRKLEQLNNEAWKKIEEKPQQGR